MSEQQLGEAPESEDEASLRGRLATLIGENRPIVFALGFFSMLSGLTEAVILYLIVQIAAVSANHKGTAANQNSSLSLLHLHTSVKTMFFLAAALVVIRIALQAPLALLPARIGADVQARLRTEVFGAFTRASWTVQSRDREGYLQETITSQVLQATNGALQATQIVVSAFTFIVLMAVAIRLNAYAASVILVTAVLLFAALRPLNRMGQRRAKALSKAQIEYAGSVSEASRLAEETQTFGAADPQRRRVEVRIATARETFYKAQILGRLAPSIYQSMIYMILVGGLAVLYNQGAGHFASLGAVILIIVRAGTYGQGVQASYQGLRQSLPFIERVQDAAKRYSDSQPVDGTLPLRHVERITFERVSFAYRPDRPVLRELDFEVAAGEAVGVIGPSGAGKSTLIQILLQLRSQDAGRYLINGTPVSDFTRADWHKRVSYVPQQPRLMHASVTENILYFRDLEQSVVERAAKLARIHDDIMSWPDGYDTIVGPRMDAVSGGQQQRICLARALVDRPEVLVLDEPTSALDPHSETLIQESLQGLRHELTLFIIAHRMSTLDICDRVMVIVDGRLVAFDTIEYLRENNSYYRSAATLATGAVGGNLP